MLFNKVPKLPGSRILDPSQIVSNGTFISNQRVWYLVKKWARIAALSGTIGLDDRVRWEGDARDYLVSSAGAKRMPGSPLFGSDVLGRDATGLAYFLIWCGSKMVPTRIFSPVFPLVNHSIDRWSSMFFFGDVGSGDRYLEVQDYFVSFWVFPRRKYMGRSSLSRARYLERMGRRGPAFVFFEKDQYGHEEKFEQGLYGYPVITRSMWEGLALCCLILESGYVLGYGSYLAAARVRLGWFVKTSLIGKCLMSYFMSLTYFFLAIMLLIFLALALSLRSLNFLSLILFFEMGWVGLLGLLACLASLLGDPGILFLGIITVVVATVELVILLVVSLIGPWPEDEEFYGHTRVF